MNTPIQIFAGLTAGALIALAGTQVMPAHSGENTPIHYIRTDTDGYSVDIYEDGSGVQYNPDGNEVRTFPARTFYWNCHEAGDLLCG